jgi:predicted CXXCH cytochrome family protein
MEHSLASTGSSCKVAAMRSRWSFALALAVVFAATLGATHLLAQNAPSPAAQPAPAFIGSERCAACHQSQHAAWKASQHAHAMAHARSGAVLGDFNNASFTKDGVTTTFLARDGRYFIRTAGPDGQPGEFEVAFTFGVEPLQQYLVQMPGGRLQAFGIAWDTRDKSAGGQRWFDLYPGQKLPAGDPLHWTGIQQTANFMCIDCHVTNLHKNFDAAANSYASTWSEVGVGCEACHGPGAAHAADPKNTRMPAHYPSRLGIAWGTDPVARPKVPLPAAGEIAEIETCARCHARRSQLTDDIHAGQPFADGFRRSLLEPGLYRADGQMQDEVFNYGSFLHSRMFSKGVTCADCHDPHSQKLRAEGNALCTQCHEPAKYQARSHHFHPPESKGAQCVSCHMPVVTYMVVDPRHDHSFRVPRPDVSAELGTPDVCTTCHRDKTAAWAAAELKTRLGRAPSGFQTFGEAFYAADRGAPGAGDLLARIVADPAQPAIVRASAIARAGALGPAAANLDLRTAFADPDPAVRAAAAEAADSRDPAEVAAPLAALLRDPTRQVRMEAVRSLAGPGEMRLSDADRAAFRAALDEYVAIQRYNGDRGEAHMNLALLEIRRGNRLLADDHLKRAIAADPTFVPAYAQLADLLRARNQEPQAEELLRQAVQRNPDSALAHYSLGLSLVRQRRLNDALAELGRAAELEPDAARYGYVYAVALDSARRRPEAQGTLDDVLKRHPYDDAALEAAAAWAAQRGETQAALGYLMTLRAVRPGDPAIDQQIEYLRRSPMRR